MILVIIIDDETLARQTLKGMLKKLCPDIKVIGQAGGVIDGVEAVKRLKPDAIFLDIMMNDGTGFDLLDQFPDPRFEIIFTTSHDQFTLTAFENNALHYLLKPIHPDKLIIASERLTKKIKQYKLTSRLEGLREDLKEKRLKNLTLKNCTEVNFIKLEHIIRLEAFDNITFFYTTGKSRITETKSLKQFERLLPENLFFRVHQSHVVSKIYIEKISKLDGWQVVMKNGTLVPIARRKQNAFLTWMEAY